MLSGINEQTVVDNDLWKKGIRSLSHEVNPIITLASCLGLYTGKGNLSRVWKSYWAWIPALEFKAVQTSGICGEGSWKR